MTASCPILVCGVGSIGERHIRNLDQLGYHNIAVYRTQNHPTRTLQREYSVFSDLHQALRQFKPAIAFITNPTSLHLSTALACAEAGCHLFIEKPVSHTMDNLGRLKHILDEHGRFAMVGYMLRFHPLLRQVKAWLDEGPSGTLGRPVYVRASWGEHVPDWHPWEDYRTSYATLPDLGGGPALSLSHELDTLVWLFGKPKKILSLATRSTPLQAKCEHGVDFLMAYCDGLVASVHLDYFQQPPQRSWKLVGTRSRVEFDYYAGSLTRYDGIIGESPFEGRMHPLQCEVIHTSADFDRNDLFLDELKYFFNCLARHQPPSPGITEAAESVRIALTATKEQGRQTPQLAHI